MTTTWTARQLRIVNNNTRDYEGGYSIETRDDEIVAGPFAAKVDAQEAKRRLVAGESIADMES